MPEVHDNYPSRASVTIPRSIAHRVVSLAEAFDLECDICPKNEEPSVLYIDVPDVYGNPLLELECRIRESGDEDAALRLVVAILSTTV